jgi:FG-GAP repeat/FG-GAP-like repeat
MRTRRALSAGIVPLLAVVVQAQAVLLTIPAPPGTALNAQFGRAIGAGHDVSGDGVPDVAVGAPFDGPAFEGVVRIYSGANGALLHNEFGTLPGDALGYTVAMAGDLDGNGISEVLISAPQGAGPTQYQVGYVRYLFGGSFASGTLYAPATPPYSPISYLNGYGLGLDGVGDVNGDGIGDAVIGRPGACSIGLWSGCTQTSPGAAFAGNAQVIAGGSGAVLQTIPGAPGDPFPERAIGVGDVDADGRPDYLLASRGTSGVSYCFGAGSCPAHNAKLSMRSGATGGQIWGFSSPPAWDIQVCRVGDLNADGRPDVILRVESWTPGAPVPYSNLIAVLSGATGSLITSMVENYGPLAARISCAGVQDLNNDGIADYVLGEGALSRVRVFSGASHQVLYTVTTTVTGPPGSPSFGWTVRDAGDVNADGFGDFVVGAPVGGGFVQVISGGSHASASGLGGGCGAPGTPPVLASSTPVLGQSILFSGTGAPVPSTGTLAYSAPSIPPVIVPGGSNSMTPCPIFLDVTMVTPLAPITPDASGSWTFAAAIPASPSLGGASIAVQAGFWPAAGGFAASNALHLVIGY